MQNNYSETKVIERQDAYKFECDLNFYCSDGWHILSTSCGFVNSERYDFHQLYQAVVAKPITNATT